MSSDSFELYNLEVDVEGDPNTFVCLHKKGAALRFVGENVQTLQEEGFSFYSLSAMLPLIAAKQRPTSQHDWMGTEDVIACPDPNCGAKFRIKRLETKVFSHAIATKTQAEMEASND